MEAKKNPRADVHQQRSKFFLVGLMISLSLLTTAFEWRSASSDIVLRKIDITEEPLQFIQATQIDPPKALTPPAIKKPKPDLVASASMSATNVTEVSDELITDAPDFNLGDPVSGVVINVEPEIDSSRLVFITSEIEPEPVGGLKNFYAIISKNLKYPAQARQLGVEGKVFVDFVIDRFGNAINIKVVRGIGAGCDEEAIRVVAIPKWNAGRQRGKPVNVRMGLPINFRLGY